MDGPMVAVGLAKTAFGVGVAVVGILLASRVLSRSLGLGRVEDELQRGNVAVAVLEVGAIGSLALLSRPAVTSTFTAMDYLYRGSSLEPAVLGHFALFAGLHVGAALLLGATSVSVGVLLYGALTRRVDELAEIEWGNIAPALAIAAMMIAIAATAGPGLQLTLDGLLPVPELVDTEHGL